MKQGIFGYPKNVPYGTWEKCTLKEKESKRIKRKDRITAKKSVEVIN